MWLLIVLCHTWIAMRSNVIFKAVTLMTVYSSRSAIDIEPLVHQNFCNGECLLDRCYDGLTEFEKSLLNTNTLSLPSHDGPTLRKSIHNNLMGLLAIKDPDCMLGPTNWPFAIWQHGQLAT